MRRVVRYRFRGLHPIRLRNWPVIVPSLIGILWLLHSTRAADADIVLYRVPKTNLVVMLQGSTSVNPGSRTVNFRHPRFSGADAKLIMALEDADIHEAPSPQAVFRRRLAKAVSTGSPAEVLNASQWALRHGLLRQFYDAVDAALELDPRNERALQVKQLKREMDIALPVSPEQKAFMQKIVPVSNMRFASSNHFLLMHDTSDKPGMYRKKPRAEERLDLLEMVYESFLLRFYSQGVELQVPKEPMMVVLFQNHADFLEYATKLSPTLSSAAGFWNSKNNISIFYDQGTTAEFKALREMATDFLDLKDQVKKNRKAYAPGEVANVVRMADTLSLLVEISQENQDIEVVTHEVTHQMAGNTGLLPRDVFVPSWAHEGLATYFEAPKDGAWSGIGAVNDTRLKWYRGLERDRVHSNIDFIVGDQIFDYAASHGGTLHGYGQAWALTHFLMERHFDELMTYYRRLGEFPADLILSKDVLQKLFREVFGDKISTLDLEWRNYMRGLKTDVELFIQNAD